MIAAVVLAGGESRRFGSDKLRQLVDGRRLLDRAMSELPAGTEVVIVGPETPGGPAAALVVGLGRALDRHADAIVVLPGDAPQAGLAAAELLARVFESGSVSAVMAVDPDGREQPLQLALRPSAAEALVTAAGPSGAVGGSARALVSVLSAIRIPLSAAAVFDIDTRDQLRIWELRTSPAVEQILRHLPAERIGEPFVIALDGPSGAGKSTLAGALALRTRCVVVSADDWSRDLGARFVSAPVVVVAGVYSARPELADLIDLSVYVGVYPAVSQTRLEHDYFTRVRPPESFDLQVRRIS